MRRRIPWYPSPFSTLWYSALTRPGVSATYSGILLVMTSLFGTRPLSIGMVWVPTHWNSAMSLRPRGCFMDSCIRACSTVPPICECPL